MQTHAIPDVPGDVIRSPAASTSQFASRFRSPGNVRARQFLRPRDGISSSDRAASQISKRGKGNRDCLEPQCVDACQGLTNEAFSFIILVHHPPNHFGGWAAGPPRKGWP